MYESLIDSIRAVQHFPEGLIPLHAPIFAGNEKKYVLDTIESTFVSSVGEYVTRFEDMLAEYCGCRRAIACCNGTAALEIALRLAGVEAGDMVLTQAMSFVATANAIVHAGGKPVFLDIDRDTLGLAPEAVQNFLEKHCHLEGKVCRHTISGGRVAACVPMHTFGHPVHMNKLLSVCDKWHIPVVEDAAEALGSIYRGKHCGTMGLLGILSFNGNKIVTTGGGGAVLTNDERIGKLAKHWTTTAKLPHRWEFRHDHVAWNFRLPNLNAALGCAQMEQIEHFLAVKRRRAVAYAQLFNDTDWQFLHEPPNCSSNYWLCAVLTNSRTERDLFLAETNAAGLQTRPAWEPLQTLSMYKSSIHSNLDVTIDIAARLVNLPSGVLNGAFL